MPFFVASKRFEQRGLTKSNPLLPGDEREARVRVGDGSRRANLSFSARKKAPKRVPFLWLRKDSNSAVGEAKAILPVEEFFLTFLGSGAILSNEDELLGFDPLKMVLILPFGSESFCFIYSINWYVSLLCLIETGVCSIML